jgi:arylsulfatase A-like enzyme
VANAVVFAKIPASGALAFAGDDASFSCMTAKNENRWTRRDFLGTVAGAAAAASLPGALHAAIPAPGKRPPNVLFLMSDDMRVELGCYGSMFRALTPNLDALAGSGVRFDRNYCQFPLCNPSRASLLTGRNPTRTGVLGNRTDFRTAHPDWTSLPQLFRQNGYVSVRAGKIFHGGIDDPKAWDITTGGAAAEEGGMQSNGVGRVLDTSKIAERSESDLLSPKLAGPSGDDAVGRQRALYSDRIIVLDGNGEGHGDYNTADRTIENLRKYKDQPFFIACGFVKPHSPPTAPQKFLDLYDSDKIRLTPDFAAMPTLPPGFPPAAIRPHNADLFIGRGASEAEAREVIRAYIASISWVDWNIGRVIAELDRLGLRDNTIIVFAVDHGYQLGEKGKWSKAGSLFEMGTRVPLMISAPGMTGNGQSCTRIVESLDIYPTLVELCGLPMQAEIEGESLVPLLRQPSAKWDKPGYTIWSEDGKTIHGTAVRTEQWRYAEFGKDGVNGAMLFDPHADPLEMKNLADDEKHKSVVAELSVLARKYAATLDAA